MSSDIFNSIKLLRALSSLALNASRDGASTTSLGNPFEYFTTLIVKNLFLISSLKSTLFQFKTITPCSIATGPAKKFVPFFLVSPL